MGDNIVWKDKTSYSQRDKVREPRVWITELGKVDVIVHRHVYCPGKWLWSSRYLNMKDQMLESVDLHEARQEALCVVAGILTNWIAELNDALASLKSS